MTISVAGRPYLIGFEAAGRGSAFRLMRDAPRIASAPSNVDVGKADVIAPFVVDSLLYILGYNGDTGDVNIWSLNATPAPEPGSAPDTPPLLMLPMWVPRWAKSWSRFAFFTFGGETFFFKINY